MVAIRIWPGYDDRNRSLVPHPESAQFVGCILKMHMHLLWTLYFLKIYNTEIITHAIAECDEETLRTKVWFLIEKLALYKVRINVVFSALIVTTVIFKVIRKNPKINAKSGQTCYTSLNCVDSEINEANRFSRKWFSHKFLAAGLWYEIG